MNNNNYKKSSGPRKAGQKSKPSGPVRGQRGGSGPNRGALKSTRGKGPRVNQIRFYPDYAEGLGSQGVSNFAPSSVAAAYSTGQETTAPQIKATRDSSRIIHRELVSSITGSANFTIPNTLALNPGIAATFPWLASQAQAWEQYRFNKLEFKYFTRTGSNIPGSMMLIPDYDAADAAPVSEQVASSYEDVTEDAPWKDQCCTLRPRAMHPIGPKKFVRSGPLAANLDIKTYDAGNLFVATVDGTAVSWGKLWVEYDVSLYTPQLAPGGGGVAEAQHFPFLSNVTPTTANMLGTVNGVSSPSSTAAIVSVSGNVLTFNQAGQFLVTYLLQGATVTQTAIPTVAGGTKVLSFGNAGNYMGGIATAIPQYVGLVVQAVPGTTITYSNTVVAGTNADLLISELPSNLV